VPLVWKVFNIRGQLVYEQHSASKGKGLQEISWDGCDMRGNKSTSGVYLIKVLIGQNSYKSKLLLNK
jgi:flagellar hook assembly protein FlgD